MITFIGICVGFLALTKLVDVIRNSSDNDEVP